MACTASSLRVPVITRQVIELPGILGSLRSLNWRGTACFADIDGTIMQAVNPHEVHRPNYLCNRPLVEIARFAETARFGFVSAADLTTQYARVIAPLNEHLRASKKIRFMQNIALSSNRGAMVAVFDPKGRELEDITRQYHKEHGIDPADYPALEEVLNKCVDQWIKDANYKGKIGFEVRPIPSGFGVDPGNRKIPAIGYPPDFLVAQIGVRPFPKGTSAREDVISMIQAILRNTELEDKYRFATGGGTTIDVNRAGINKQSGILWLMDYWGIPCDPLKSLDDPGCMPVLGLGDEYQIKADREGQPSLGGDMSMLEIPNLLGLAVNNDPRSIDSVLNFCHDTPTARRIIPLGSGPAATLKFMIWANNSKTLPGTRIDDMPVTRNKEVDIPKGLSDFVSTAREEGILVVSGSMLTGFRHGKDVIDSAQSDPTLENILTLIQKGIPVVVASGGDHGTRIKPIFQALKEALARMNAVTGAEPISAAVLENLLFYSNGGTIKAGISGSDIIVDESYLQRFLFDEKNAHKIAKALESIAQVYNRTFEKEHRLEYAFKRAGVDTRTYPTQISLTPLLIGNRGWVRQRFLEAANTNGFPQVEMHFGGYSMDITKKGVNKGGIIDDCLGHFSGLEQKRRSILYIGGEFYFHLDHTGIPLSGIDMEIFRAQNRDAINCVIALTNNQDAIPEHPQILRGGSGVPALIQWLKFLNENV
mgnify:FL=1